MRIPQRLAVLEQFAKRRRGRFSERFVVQRRNWPRRPAARPAHNNSAACLMKHLMRKIGRGLTHLTVG
mgnify:CR=1 FL=1